MRLIGPIADALWIPSLAITPPSARIPSPLLLLLLFAKTAACWPVPPITRVPSSLRIRSGFSTTSSSSLSNLCVSMSEVPTVTYWAGRGRGEPLRCILAAANVKFENVFIKGREHFLEICASGKLAYDQVPLVEIDGVNLVQSMPAAIYLAQKYGFYPEDIKDQFVTNAACASVIDARGPLLYFPFNNDPAKTTADLDAPGAMWQRYCPKWEAMLESGKNTYLCGQKPMLGDIAVFELLDFYHHVFGADAFQAKMKAFPRLLALHDGVLALGYLKAWRDEERKKLYLDWPEYKTVVMQSLGKA